MDSVSFFFGQGKSRFWYIVFYIFALPVYLTGIYLLTQLKPTSQPETRELVLNIFSLGYLLLGVFSLINTIVYANKTKKFFWAFFVFFGVQLLFWIIGYNLGNNYIALAIFFSIFLGIAVFGNLKALSFFHAKNQPLSKHHITK